MFSQPRFTSSGGEVPGLAGKSRTVLSLAALDGILLFGVANEQGLQVLCTSLRMLTVAVLWAGLCIHSYTQLSYSASRSVIGPQMRQPRS